MKVRCLVSCVVLVLGAAGALAQSAKVEPIGAPPGALPHEIASALDDQGWRITLDDGWTAELWLAKNLKLTTGAASSALYPELSNGEFVGVINLRKGMSDFRGQTIPAGIYSLRYQLLPEDGNHLGVAPNPDFLLAIPVAADTKPDTQYSFEKLVALSSKSTGAHPAVLAMAKAGQPATATFNDEKMLVMTVNTRSQSGQKPERLGVVVMGQATQ